MIGFVAGRLAVGLVVGGVLVLGAYSASEAVGEAIVGGPVPARELCRGAVCVPEADALRATIKRERAAAKLAQAAAYQRGRRSIVVQTNTEHFVRVGAIIFGHDPDRAVERAKCESGHAMTPRARNGQFIGVFQIGTRGPGSMWARAAGDLTAHGIPPTDALANVLVAMRYAARHGWGEWQCGGWSHR